MEEADMSGSAAAEVSGPWEILGFIDGYGDGRPAWSVGVNNVPGVLAYLAGALPDTECAAIVLRRVPSSLSDDAVARPWWLASVDGQAQDGP